MDNYAKTPTVFQMEAAECGAACLAMIFAYYGYEMPLEQMRVETGVSRDGCNAANLMRAAKRFGLECHGFRREPDGLKKLKPPCIIHWNFNHFVVFEGFRGEYAYINDPAVGRRKITMDELNDAFTGVVLTFGKTDAFQPQKQKSTLPEFVRRHLAGQEAVLLQFLCIGLLLIVPGLILPVLGEVFVDDILIGGYTDWLTKILVFITCCVAFRAALSFYRSVLLQKLKSKLTLISGRKFLLHLFRLPMSFFDQRTVGDLVTRMQNHNAVSDFLAGEFAETLLNVLTAVFYLVILCFYSPEMTLIGLVQVGISIAVIALSNRTVADATLKMQMGYSKLYHAVCGGLEITDTVKASGVESVYSARVLGYHAKKIEDEQTLTRFQQLVGAIPEGVGHISNALLLVIGGVLVINGKLTMGMLAAFSSLFAAFCQPTDALVGFIRNIQELKSNLSRVEDIERHAEDDVYNEQDNVEFHGSKLSGEVDLHDISFGYSSLKPPTVEHFDFHLNCGESIAFVGPSGCGKSTISKVISGLYLPWSGTVSFDGVDAAKIPREVRNASIATVSQNISLFSGTVRDNITMWNPAILEEDMIAAAKDACIHDFIMRQQGGYQYMLSENASNLSGGQRQRLEIARALATKPTILIMDEATSALDAIVEKEIMDNIRRRGCTCIIVAHRLSAIRDCNQIVVMQHGKIIQRGTHRSLLAEDGYYRNFIQNI